MPFLFFYESLFFIFFVPRHSRYFLHPKVKMVLDGLLQNLGQQELRSRLDGELNRQLDKGLNRLLDKLR